MSRPLLPGLVAEGDSDCDFLLKVIDRQLEALVQASRAADCDLFRAVRSACVKKHGQDGFRVAAIAMAKRCDLVFVHADHHERHEAEKLAAGIGCARRPAIVLVPKRETEAWVLADANAFSVIRGADVSILPGPEAVEKEKNPKGLLKSVLAPAKVKKPTEYFAFLGEHVDLKTLAKVPAYAAWLADTEKALKELNYL